MTFNMVATHDHDPTCDAGCDPRTNQESPRLLLCTLRYQVSLVAEENALTVEADTGQRRRYTDRSDRSAVHSS